jgi:hypothetical protein
VPKVFISYSRSDHHFAELLRIKLKEKAIEVWLDNGSLRAGNDWRQEIDKGINSSDLVIVALSKNSTESSYVTYEWAYAMGQGKAVLPLKLDECDLHPKLEPIQHLIFSIPGKSPWEELIERIQDLESDYEPPEEAIPPEQEKKVDENVTNILAYLNARGFQMVSFDKLRDKNVCNLTDNQFNKLIASNKNTFRGAKLKGGKQGVAKF